MSTDKPVTIIVTLLPPKKGKRKLLVSAAPENEMPLLLTGDFSERHALLDRAYAAVMKRDPQVVTVKEEKAMSKANRAPKTTAQLADEAEEAGDQLVADESVGAETEDLPVIDGDDVETLHATSQDATSQEVPDGQQD